MSKREVNIIFIGRQSAIIADLSAQPLELSYQQNIIAAHLPYGLSHSSAMPGMGKHVYSIFSKFQHVFLQRK